MSSRGDDAYEVLGLQPGASLEEVKRAYFEQVRRFPPDRFPEEFKRIRQAYEELVNRKEAISADKRAEDERAAEEWHEIADSMLSRFLETRDSRRLRQARHALQKALDMGLERADVFLNMGRLCLLEERFEEADSWFARADAVLPSLPEEDISSLYRVLANLCIAAVEMRRYSAYEYAVARLDWAVEKARAHEQEMARTLGLPKTGGVEEMVHLILGAHAIEKVALATSKTDIRAAKILMHLALRYKHDPQMAKEVERLRRESARVTSGCAGDLRQFGGLGIVAAIGVVVLFVLTEDPESKSALPHGIAIALGLVIISIVLLKASSLIQQSLDRMHDRLYFNR